MYSSGDFGVAGNFGMLSFYVPEARTCPSSHTLHPNPQDHCMNKQHQDVATGGTVVRVSSYDEWERLAHTSPFFPQVQPYVP